MGQHPGTLGTMNSWLMDVHPPKNGSNRFWPSIWWGSRSVNPLVLSEIDHHLGWFTKKPGDWQPPITGCISGEKPDEITSARAWTLEANTPAMTPHFIKEISAILHRLCDFARPHMGMHPLIQHLESPARCIELHRVASYFCRIYHDHSWSIYLHKSP